MVKFLGNKKIQIAVFISGTGSNLKSLINYSLKNNNKIKIIAITPNSSEMTDII